MASGPAELTCVAQRHSGGVAPDAVEQKVKQKTYLAKRIRHARLVAAERLPR